MAVQPISETGVIYSTGSQPAIGPARPLSLASAALALGSLIRAVPLRPVSSPFARYDYPAFVRAEAQRALSPAVLYYVFGGLQSLESLRRLSRAFDRHVTAGLLRAVALREMRPGYLLVLPEPEAPPDSTPPRVNNYDPLPGTPISRSTPISFDVTEETGEFIRIFVVAFFPGTGISELVHDGDGFRGFYAASSFRRMIAGGFRYTVLRAGGWPAAPTIQTFVADRAGNEAN